MAITPGRGYDNSRLNDTEVRGDRLLRVKDARHSRDAAPFVQRRGKHRAKTLTRGTKGTETQVALYYWNGTRYKDSGVRVRAKWWYLNGGDTFEPGFKCVVEFFADNTWEITGIWCEKDDTEESATPPPPPGYSPGESPGEQATEASSDAPLIEISFGVPDEQNAIGGPAAWQDF